MRICSTQDGTKFEEDAGMTDAEPSTPCFAPSSPAHAPMSPTDAPSRRREPSTPAEPSPSRLREPSESEELMTSEEVPVKSGRAKGSPRVRARRIAHA